MKKYLVLLVLVITTLPILYSCKSKTQREIPRTIQGITLSTPISQYTQFQCFRAIDVLYTPYSDDIEVYCNWDADEFDPYIIGVKDGKIVYITIYILDSHSKDAKKELLKYGDGTDGKTTIHIDYHFRYMYISYCDTEYMNERQQKIDTETEANNHRYYQNLKNL